jgi:hypothetical protein
MRDQAIRNRPPDTPGPGGDDTAKPGFDPSNALLGDGHARASPSSLIPLI